MEGEEEEESHRGISLGSRWPPRGYNLVPSSSKPVLPWSIKRTQVHLAKGKAEIIIGWCRVERIKVGSRFSSGRKRGRSALGKGILRVGIGVRACARACVLCGLCKKGQGNFMGGGRGVKIGGGIVRRDYTRRLASPSSIFHAHERTGRRGLLTGCIGGC